MKLFFKIVVFTRNYYQFFKKEPKYYCKLGIFYWATRNTNQTTFIFTPLSCKSTIYTVCHPQVTKAINGSGRLHNLYVNSLKLDY